jgi:hypothetical protein
MLEDVGEMMRTSGTVALTLVAMLAMAASAPAEEPTLESYIAQIEAICKRDKEAGKQILSGARERINRGRIAPAGRQFIRASARFGATIKQLVAVPRPAAAEAKLQRWFKFLRLVRTRVRKTGQHFVAGRRVDATHESIRGEKSGNAANNVSFGFGVRECRLSRSRFS